MDSWGRDGHCLQLCTHWVPVNSSKPLDTQIDLAKLNGPPNKKIWMQDMDFYEKQEEERQGGGD